jgi:regulatory protein YycI of two-component signal transduction system YycFG
MRIKQTVCLFIYLLFILAILLAHLWAQNQQPPNKSKLESIAFQVDVSQ